MSGGPPSPCALARRSCFTPTSFAFRWIRGEQVEDVRRALRSALGLANVVDAGDARAV